MTQRTQVAPVVPGSIVWSYDEDRTQVSSLYELAKQKAWNVTSDVDWRTPACLDDYPTEPEANPLRGFPPYEALPESEKILLSWRQHSLEISEILHGEQGALLIASQLVSCLPSVEAKLFAASQAFDEARHVEFFSRYLKEVVGQVHAPSAELAQLIEGTVNDERWDIKFIACQILIESLAMAKFQEIKAKCRVPILQFAIGYIAKDEARHVNFGVEFLRNHLQQLSASEMEARSEFVLHNVLKLANAMNIHTRIGEACGWDQAELRLHLRKFRILHPETTQHRFRQLLMNLSAVGLASASTVERIRSMGVML